MIIRKKTVIDIFTVLIVLLPFLYQYKSPLSFISLGEILLCPIIVYFMFCDFKGKIRLRMYNGLYLYFFLAVITSLIASVQVHFSVGDFATVFVRIVFYGLLIYFSYGNIDVEAALSLCVNLSVLFCAYAVVQLFAYMLFGIYLPTTINRNWVFAAEAGTRTDYALYYRYLYRPSSLFLEPSYLVFFCGPGLAAALLRTEKKKTRWLKALIITLGLVASGASSGFMVIMLVWGAYFIEELKASGKKISLPMLSLGILSIIAIILIFRSSLAETLLNRLKSGGSFNNRITRGFLIYQETSVMQKLFGVGINNLGNFVTNNHIYTVYDEVNLDYAATFIGTMLCSGVFTLIAYCRFFIKSWMPRNTMSRILVVTLFAMGVIGNISFNYRFAYYVVLILGIQFSVKQKTGLSVKKEE